ncbi:receptor-type protein kinase, putative [Bodo saltans]|uniref:Receptor-type protein kinase, putative n=1 Tax=Bodo saltans TaxID=75058 RepID=A0A0S4JMF2_BODSA|nr:receptor-type protein kinase, putative [Bodo saltans]|eukprot:CUG91417.1 receptor-type protein kinase, putative [Bodo saltans]
MPYWIIQEAQRRLMAFSAFAVSFVMKKKVAAASLPRRIPPPAGTCRKLTLHITTVDISWCTLITDAGLSHLTPLSAHLQTLSVCSLSKLTDSGLLHIASLHNLQLLDLACCFAISNECFQQFRNLPRLHSVSLRGCGQVRDSGVKLLCENAPNLTQLDLCGCTQITDEALVSVGALFNLVNLVLWGCTKITDTGLSNLASLDELRVLVLNDCLHITTEGVVTHVGALKSLRRLYVEQCRQISEGIVQRLPGMEISQLNDV